MPGTFCPLSILLNVWVTCVWYYFSLVLLLAVSPVPSSLHSVWVPQSLQREKMSQSPLQTKEPHPRVCSSAKMQHRPMKRFLFYMRAPNAVKQSFSSACFYSSYCLILGIFRFYNHRSVWLNHLTHWTDGSAVSSACCCWLRPRFDGSQPSINPFSGILFWTSWIWDIHVHIHTGKKKKKNSYAQNKMHLNSLQKPKKNCWDGHTPPLYIYVLDCRVALVWDKDNHSQAWWVESNTWIHWQK